jgi:hypothetical protein
MKYYSDHTQITRNNISAATDAIMKHLRRVAVTFIPDEALDDAFIWADGLPGDFEGVQSALGAEGIPFVRKNA